jgi:uncharacterized protein YidB (DUF937 family)
LTTSLFDQIKYQLGGSMAAETAGAAGAESPAHDPHAMPDCVVRLIAQHGWLGGLVKKFEAGGLGTAAASWVGTGENQDVSPTQAESAAGSEVVSQITAKLRLPPEQATQLLSKYVPLVINQLTPNGKVEEGGLLEKGLDFIKSRRAGGTKPGN